MSNSLRRLTGSLIASSGARDSAIMTAATLVAGGFDYLVLVAAGLLLDPRAAISFLAVMNLLKIAEQGAWVIRNLVAYYVSTFSVEADALGRTGGFLRRRWRWAWRWGSAAALLLALLALPLDRLLGIGSPAAMLAGAGAVLFFFLRPVTDGALQGAQRFLGLGSVIILQAIVRFALTILLIFLGLELAGAVLALPLSSGVALALGLWLLKPYFAASTAADAPRISARYSILTLTGLWAFAALVYGDAILVNRLFPSPDATEYTPVVILARINLFVPLALGMVFFPKATRRRALGRDARPLLMATLAATLAPGILLAAVYFAAPALVVDVVFLGRYADPGLLLGWVGLATALFAGVNIWLNYALSVERRGFIGALVLLAFFQLGAIAFLASSLMDLAFILLATSLVANGLGFWLFFIAEGQTEPRM